MGKLYSINQRSCAVCENNCRWTLLPEVFDVLGQVVGLKDARAEDREQRIECYRSVATHCHFLAPRNKMAALG